MLRKLAAIAGLVALTAGACGGSEQFIDRGDSAAETEATADSTPDAAADESSTDPGTPTPTPTPTPEPTPELELTGTAFTNDSKVSTAGIDEVFFGSSAAAAAQAASTLWVGLPEGPRPECYVVVPANGPEGIHFWVLADNIERFDISTPALRTRSGYGVGTALTDLEESLGELLTVAALDDGGSQATFTPSDDADRYRLVFDVGADGFVTAYRAGRSGIVDRAADDCGSIPEVPMAETEDAASSDSGTAGEQAAAPEPLEDCRRLEIGVVTSEVPEPVREAAQAIQDAALECDVAALDTLTGDPFTASFGGGTFLEIYGDDAEAIGELAASLNFRPATNPDGSFTWPRASVLEWSQVDATMLDELRVMGHDDAAFASFADFGAYIGQRATITSDAEWIVFVGGD